MAPPTQESDAPRKLKKDLSMLGVFALSTGATLSAGLFLLPGLAAQVAGPAVVLCYLLAAIPLVPAMFSIVELSTAMPRAGGAYYFLDRSLGPLAGTIGGLGTWLALTLKTAFALVGMGAYIRLFLPDGVGDGAMTSIAVGFALLLGGLNWLGAKKTGSFQIALVIGLLVILGLFMFRGVPSLEVSRFAGFFDHGLESIIATTGTVYISYVGITGVASVAEEVRNPERTLPRAVFSSLAVAVVVYGICVSLMVGLLAFDELSGSYTPMADAALAVAGKFGMYVVAVGALLAFASVSNAGILAASRYPLAMGRDRLMPEIFRWVDRRGAPVVGIAITVGAIIAFLLVLDPLRIAKLASAFQLLMFGLLCLAVIVMRESRIASYDPGYKSPFYPWMQIAGIVLPLLLITAMGWLPILFTAGIIGVGAAWFYYYASDRVQRSGAIYHVFERLGRMRFDALDTELREILKEKGLRAQDPFDDILDRAVVLDTKATSFDAIVHEASDELAAFLPRDAETLFASFMEGTRTGATPVTGGVALPHLRLPDLEGSVMVVVRCCGGVDIEIGMKDGRPGLPTWAIFFLVSPEDDPALHLRLLARLASRVDDPDFMPAWKEAEHSQELRQLLMPPERSVTLELTVDGPCADLIDQAMRFIGLPEGCLVALVHRHGEAIVPTGKTVMRVGDRLTVIGSVEAVREVVERYPG